MQNYIKFLNLQTKSKNIFNPQKRRHITRVLRYSPTRNPTRNSAKPETVKQSPYGHAKMTQMKNFLLPFLLGCLATFLLMQGCESCRGKTTSNTTDNINQVDSLKIIQQAQAPLRGQIVENERIITELAATIDALKVKAAQGNKNAERLAAIIEEQKRKLESEKAKLERLTVLLTETQADFHAVLKKQGVGDEVGEDLPTYSTQYTDPDDWFSLTGEIDPNSERATFNLNVRNEFVISDFVAADGVAKFRVESRNPYSYVMPGTNTFEVPIQLNRPKQRRLGLGFTAGAFAGKDFFNPGLTAGYGIGFGIYYRIL